MYADSSDYLTLVCFQSRAGAADDSSLSARSRVRKCVITHWKDMKKEFRLADPSATGQCHVDDFRCVFRLSFNRF